MNDPSRLHLAPNRAFVNSFRCWQFPDTQASMMTEMICPVNQAHSHQPSFLPALAANRFNSNLKELTTNAEGFA